MSPMSEILVGEIALTNLSQINILMGKNGCGKSRILREIDANNASISRYITPERSGAVLSQPGIDEAISTNINYLGNERRKNQVPQFKHQSVSLFRNMASIIHKRLEEQIDGGKNINKIDKTELFLSNIKKINRLLENIRIERSELDFNIFSKETGQKLAPVDISSGESELISLAIEILYYTSLNSNEGRLLLIDEPDVHLHPDLQHRFCRFVRSNVRTTDITVIIATHSSAIIGAFGSSGGCSVAFMKSGDKKIEFCEITTTLKKIVPIFGAHPLSSVFNKTPILLLEGDDDVRIWQQAVRSTEGKLKLFPCSVGGKPNLNSFEVEVRQIIESVYDRPRAFSIRDRDGGELSIEDLGPIKRARLRCRASENLLLCDDVLASLGVTWNDVKKGTRRWLGNNSEHKYHTEMVRFSEGGFDRLGADVKGIRHVLLGIMGDSRLWEILVGKSIAALFQGNGHLGRGSLKFFLGRKIRNEVLSIN